MSALVFVAIQHYNNKESKHIYMNFFLPRFLYNYSIK